MMTQAFYTGVSGIQNYSNGIDILSNNLANISTVGYKEYNSEFASLFEASINSTASLNSDNIGTGVRIQASTMNSANGTLMESENSTDLAIVGDGWFGIENGGDVSYTRDGSFNIDANSNLVTTDGFYVLGTLGNNIDENGTLTKQIDNIPLGDISSQEKLKFPSSLTYPPEASTNVKIMGNLGVDSNPITISSLLVDENNEKTNLQIVFEKDANQVPPGVQYNITATITSLDGQTTYETQSGRVEFDDNGAFKSSTLNSIKNGNNDIALDFGTGLDGLTAIDTFDISCSSMADGTVGGELMGYSLNSNGDVMATFSNGKESSIAKIAVYHFQNEQGLQRLNGTKFQESPNSGSAYFFKDENGNNVIGTDVLNHRLESSNVDISVGLTDLIILQRSYDANSKSITTADQMMQKALNMDA